MSERNLETAPETDNYSRAMDQMMRRHDNELRALRVRQSIELISLALDFPEHDGARQYILAMQSRPGSAELVERAKQAKPLNDGQPTE